VGDELDRDIHARQVAMRVMNELREYGNDERADLDVVLASRSYE
jgi:hypothetical protein